MTPEQITAAAETELEVLLAHLMSESPTTKEFLIRMTRDIEERLKRPDFTNEAAFAYLIAVQTAIDLAAPNLWGYDFQPITLPENGQPQQSDADRSPHG